MNTKRRILAINGSYRNGGITDQAVDSLVADLQGLDVEVEQIRLRDVPIRFCLNCRECMQQPGDKPGTCVHKDGMTEIIEKIEAADGFILAAPTNFYSVTALFKRFSERLAVYGYWPWGKAAPKFRKATEPKKKALLITSCAAPGFMGRFWYETPKQLRHAARTVGARSIGVVNPGLVSQESGPVLSKRMTRRTEKLARKLLH